MIKLRYKTLAGGKKSYYLDIYFKGTRSYDFLNLYVQPNTPRKEVKRIEAIAEQIRTRREESLLAGYHGITPSFSTDLNFLDYFQSIAEEKNLKMYNTALKHVREYQTTPISIASINSSWISSFKAYLEARVSINSAGTYLNATKAVLNRAVDDNIIMKNPFTVKIRTQNIPKIYLTIDELKKIINLKNLSQTQEHCRKAFIFACFTGLRISDLKNLKWDKVNLRTKKISVLQIKTSEYIENDLPKSAIKILEQLTNNSSYVFSYLLGIKDQTYGVHLKEIARKAGIEKNVTSHTARHTFGTMMYALTKDLLLVSKLMGHTSTRRTEIYAKLLDSTKQDAINKLPDLWKK